LADTRPVRESPEYRRLWVGGSLSGLGSQMTGVAVAVQVYALTRSSLAVGLLGLALAVPLITLGLPGGTFADAVDRRKLVLLSSSLLALVSLTFAAQALLDLRLLWLLYLLTALQSSLFAVDQPARRTFIPRLLPQNQIPAAAALSFLSFQVSLVAGPLLAGVIIAVAGLKLVYLLDAVTFAFALYPVARLGSMRVAAGAPVGLRAIAEGLRFVRSQPVIATVLLADINGTVFGMPRALFPAFAATRFGGGPQTVGLLYAAPAIGGLLIAAFSGPLGRFRRQGLAVLVAISVWGATIAGFGLTRLLWLAVVLLAVAGAADVVNGVFRTTILQTNIPDALIGRVNSVGFVVGAGGPHIGDVEAGAVAALTSPVISAVSGGVACVAGVVLIGLAAPVLARYDASKPRQAATPE
jgi:MFS family permease